MGFGVWIPTISSNYAITVVDCAFTKKRILRSLVNMKKLAAVAFIALLSGCSSTEVVRQLDLSVGQQLIDLKKARDNGALSASEYEEQRRKLIRNVE
jgi:hypothetical protein